MPDYGKVQEEAEKLLAYRYPDKGRERSNHAAGMAELARGTKRRCPLRHNKIAWSGPPYDTIRCYICLLCNAAASEPEIKSRGYDFDTVPDWIMDEIFDLDLERQSVLGNPAFFGGFGGLDLGPKTDTPIEPPPDTGPTLVPTP